MQTQLATFTVFFFFFFFPFDKITGKALTARRPPLHCHVECGRTLRLNTSVCYSTTISPQQVPNLRDPTGYTEKVPSEVPGGQQKRWTGKTRAAASLLFNFFSQMSTAKQQSLLKNTPSTSTLTPHHSSVPVAATCIQTS